MIVVKPSEIRLSASFPPLASTFGRSEHEAAAALIVLACIHNGDRWQPVTTLQIYAALVWAVDVAKKQPFIDLSRNTFWRPDFIGLIKAGHAIGECSSTTSPIELTGLAIETLIKKYGPPSRTPRKASIVS